MTALPAGRRARSADAKEIRRASLLAAARRMLAARGYEAFTMAQLAEDAGLAKGTAYLYFPTKEALLLDVLTADLARFFDRLAVTLTRPGRADRAAYAGGAIADALLNIRGLLPLLELLHSHLERNVPETSLAAFKQFLLERLSHAGALLERTTGLASGAGLLVFLRAHALAIGLAQMANHPPALERVFARTPALGVLRIDFREAFAAALTDQIRALARAVAPHGTGG